MVTLKGYPFVVGLPRNSSLQVWQRAPNLIPMHSIKRPHYALTGASISLCRPSHSHDFAFDIQYRSARIPQLCLPATPFMRIFLARDRQGNVILNWNYRRHSRQSRARIHAIPSPRNAAVYESKLAAPFPVLEALPSPLTGEERAEKLRVSVGRSHQSNPTAKADELGTTRRSCQSHPQSRLKNGRRVPLVFQFGRPASYLGKRAT